MPNVPEFQEPINHKPRKKLKIKRRDKKLEGHEVVFETIRARQPFDIVKILHEED